MVRAKLPVWLATLVLCALAPAVPATASSPGGTFFDDDGSVHEGAIEAVAAAGITVGCDELGERFCPDRAVTRAEMATFLVRALGVAPQDPVRFTDAAGVHRGSIGAAEGAGWFKGCNPPANDMFCPNEALTRGQAAAVLVRAFDLPEVAGTEFVDDDGSMFETAIERLAAAGVTKGCNPPANDRFCPNRPVTRGEMATFLARLLGLETVTVESPFEGRIVLGLWSGLVAYGGIATMEGTRIPNPLLIDSVGLPAISPDGETIAFTDYRRECPADATGPWDCYTRIFTIPFTGGSQLQLTPNEAQPGQPDWLPDGGSIGFIDHRETGVPDFPIDWYLARADISDPRTVVDIAGPASYALADPDWSVSGEIVAQAQQPLADTVLLILDADGAEQAVIAEVGHSLVSPRWSPDGTQLAYLVHSDGESRLVVSDPDGSNRRVVATLPGADEIAWAPDGSQIAYISGFRAWAIPVSGGDPWPLTPTDVAVFDIDWGPAAE